MGRGRTSARDRSAENKGSSGSGAAPDYTLGGLIPGGDAGVLAQMDERYASDLEFWASVNRESAGQLDREARALVADVLADSEVAIQVPGGLLGAILGDGRLKSQFETNASGGLLHTRYRNDAEEKGFGINPATFPPEQRPIYGYLGSRGKYLGTSEVTQYGDVKLVMKDSVRARATFTIGDSLSSLGLGHAVPTPLTANPLSPGYRIPLTPPNNGTGRLLDHVYSSPAKVRHLGSYWEVQIHGGVKTRDIARVEFSKPPSAATQAALSAQGIQWSVEP